MIHGLFIHGNANMKRRNFLQMGALGAFGLILADVLRLQASTGKPSVEGTAKSVIHIYLPG